MIAEDTKGLFQRVIIQSAPLGISRGRVKMNTKMSLKAATVKDDTQLEEVLCVQAEVEEAAQGFGLKSAMPLGVVLRLSSTSSLGITAEETALFLVMSPNLMRLRRLPLVG